MKLWLYGWPGSENSAMGKSKKSRRRSASRSRRSESPKRKHRRRRRSVSPDGSRSRRRSRSRSRDRKSFGDEKPADTKPEIYGGDADEDRRRNVSGKKRGSPSRGRRDSSSPDRSRSSRKGSHPSGRSSRIYNFEAHKQKLVKIFFRETDLIPHSSNEYKGLAIQWFSVPGSKILTILTVGFSYYLNFNKILSHEK